MGQATGREIPGDNIAGLEIFGEGQGRIVVSIPPDIFRQGGGTARVSDLGAEFGVPVTRLGSTVAGDSFAFGPISTTVSAIREAFETPI